MLNTGKAQKIRSATESECRSSVLCVNKDEGDLARRVSAVHPSMIRASLDEDVARLEVNLRIVKEHVDLAR